MATQQRVPIVAGEVFGRLMTKHRVYMNRFADCAYWLCECECGNEHTVPAKSLRSGATRSCGCLRREVGKKNTVCSTKHNLSKTPSYSTWLRLRRTKDLVCTKWYDNVAQFIKDVGNRPSKHHSLKRIDSTKLYEPGNVHWVETACNSRREYLFHGELLQLKEIARRVRMHVPTIHYRLTELGLDIYQAANPNLDIRSEMKGVKISLEQRRILKEMKKDAHKEL